jgi:hypothetical protein
MEDRVARNGEAPTPPRVARVDPPPILGEGCKGPCELDLGPRTTRGVRHPLARLAERRPGGEGPYRAFAESTAARGFSRWRIIRLRRSRRTGQRGGFHPERSRAEGPPEAGRRAGR